MSTGMLIDYHIYYTDTAIDYPNFKFIDNNKIHRILRIFKDNFIEDYIFIENSPELFNLLDNFRIILIDFWSAPIIEVNIDLS